MSGRLVAAICSDCGGDIIFFTKRRRRFAEQQLRCPSCIATAASPDALSTPDRSAVALYLMLMESRLKRALDPDEPDSPADRIDSFRAVIDDLRDLTTKLVPPSQSGPATST
jgi:hypothetical protein